MTINKKASLIASLASIVAVLVAFSMGQHQADKLYTDITNSLDTTSLGVSLFDIEIPIKSTTVKYGFALDKYEVTESTIKKGEFLSEILDRHHVPYSQIDRVANRAKDVFDVNKLRIGKDYMVLSPKEGNQPATHFIYEPSPFRYIIYDLQDTTRVAITERPIDTLRRTASGIITSSLWNTMVENDLSYAVASKMESAFAWSVDFHHIQKNDKFKLIFDELYIEGEKVGVGKVEAAFFQQNKKDYYAYQYKDDIYEGFFDDEGRPMKQAFLKSPVEYARISSAFNLRRFHPVLKRVRAHLGTDYAAPTGTPILSVANGVVERKGYGRGNGNFVKVKHDKTYSTQYLHMSKFKKGIGVGSNVRQGEVIGYVGSTGLATGPHVCFRFWKNGKQIDHRKENLPRPEPMTAEHLQDFKVVAKELRAELEKIEYKEVKEKGSIVVKDP